MNVLVHAKRAAVVAVVLFSCTAGAVAQQQPSPAAVAAAKELIQLKGADQFFQPIVRGVVEQTKNLFLQTNPMLSKDLNEVANALATELGPRWTEIEAEISKGYATQFTEQELKDLVAFYKTPLGKKSLELEPRIMDASMNFARDWANKLSETVISRMRAEMKKKGHDL